MGMALAVKCCSRHHISCLNSVVINGMPILYHTRCVAVEPDALTNEAIVSAYKKHAAAAPRYADVAVAVVESRLLLNCAFDACMVLTSLCCHFFRDNDL